MVKLENGAKYHHGSKAGRYERSSDINGKPCYRMGKQAIYYYPDSNQWKIGHIDKIGIGRCRMYAQNNFGGLTDEKNVWKYFDKTQKSIRTSESNDIVVKGITGTYFQASIIHPSHAIQI